jgi:hypothetical protein
MSKGKALLHGRNLEIFAIPCRLSAMAGPAQKMLCYPHSRSDGSAFVFGLTGSKPEGRSLKMKVDPKGQTRTHEPIFGIFVSPMGKFFNMRYIIIICGYFFKKFSCVLGQRDLYSKRSMSPLKYSFY